MRRADQDRDGPGGAMRLAGRFRAVTVAACLALGLWAGGPVAAADLETAMPVVSEEPVPEWSIDVTPYFWMAGLSGTAAAFGAPPSNVDMSFSDILDGLHMSVMVFSEVRRGRFSLSTDFLYISMSTGATTPFQTLVSKIGLDSQTLEASAFAGYSVIDNERLRLDVLAGPRLWYVSNKLSFKGGLLGGRTFDDSATWVDAMGGARARFAVTDKLGVTGMALAGGGGSDFGWDLLGALSYNIGDRFSAKIGYRAVGVDYDRNGFEYDMTIHGPVIGATLHF